jgi:hypothetical protein
MGVPFANLGINAVHLDNKIKFAFSRIYRIKKHITGKLRKLASDSSIGMLDLKEKIRMHRIKLPFLCQPL